MERLEPILKQKFWILLGIGIVMTITGWWMATGSMAATIATRKEDIKKAQGKIPSGEIPNNDWTTNLAAKNVSQDQAVRTTASVLWARQRDRMTWPDTVSEFAWKNGYRGEIALAGRENYRTAYGYDVRRVWQTIRPFNRLDGTGIVEFGADERALLQRAWGSLAPPSAEMWDAQEDLWLLQSIFKSLVAVNGGPEGERLDASIHVLEKIELHGGQPASQRKSQSAGGSPGGMPGGSPAGPGGAHGSSTSGFNPGSDFSSASGKPQAAASAQFDWREEFGDDGSGAGAGGGPGVGSMAGPGSGHGQPGGGGGPGGTTGSRVRRYIDDEEALPYKTRGFYMSLIMDHRKIPDLIAELTSSENSAWPVEVVRVQVARLHEDDVDGQGPGTGLFPRSGGSGSRGSSMPPGAYPTSPSFGPGSSDFSSTFPSPTGVGNVSGTAASAQAEAAAAALENALQDPYMAQVALCGIIYLYKEVKPADVAPVSAPPVVPSTQPAPAAVPTAGTDKTPAANPTPDSAVPQPAIPGSNPATEAQPAGATTTTPATTPATENAPPKAAEEPGTQDPDAAKPATGNSPQSN